MGQRRRGAAMPGVVREGTSTDASSAAKHPHHSGTPVYSEWKPNSRNSTPPLQVVGRGRHVSNNTMPPLKERVPKCPSAEMPRKDRSRGLTRQPPCAHQCAQPGACRPVPPRLHGKPGRVRQARVCYTLQHLAACRATRRCALGYPSANMQHRAMSGPEGLQGRSDLPELTLPSTRDTQARTCAHKVPQNAAHRHAKHIRRRGQA